MNIPGFFDKKINNIYFPYIIKMIRKKLNIDDTTSCELYRDNRTQKIKINNNNDNIYKITKKGSDFCLFDNNDKQTNTFTYTQVESLMVLDNNLTVDAVVNPDDLLDWLQKENGVGYIEYNNERWYAIKHLIKITGDFPAKDHIWKRSCSNDNYADLEKLNNLGLTHINNISLTTFNGYTMRLTFINKNGLNEVLNKKSRNKDIKILFDKVIIWFGDNYEKDDIINDIIVKFDDSILEFNTQKIRITPDNLISVYDFVQVYYGVKYPKKKVDLFKKVNTELFEFTNVFQFSGKGQIKQYVCDIDRISSIISHSSKYSEEINNKFINYIKNNLSNEQIESIEVNESIKSTELINLTKETKSTESLTSDLSNLLIFDESIPEFYGKKIRITPNKRVSVFDVIKVFSDVCKPRDTWYELIKTYPEIHDNSNEEEAGQIGNFKFDGQGQRETPVMDLKGIIKLIMILPGKHASNTRTKFTNIIIRYLGGDLSMIDELHKNKELIEEAKEDNPINIFKIDNTSQHIIKIEDYCDNHNIPHIPLESHLGDAGVYLTYVGLHNGKSVLKFGLTGVSTEKRISDHFTKFTKLRSNNFKCFIRPVYFGKTLYYQKVETEFKKKMIQLGLYFGSRYRIGNINNNELFTISEEYSIKRIINIMNDLVINTNKGFEEEILELKKLKYNHIENMKKIEANLELEKERTKQMELQIELLKLQKSII